jgi:hypothetical protein
MIDDIISYRELCDNENVQTLQRGMNFRLNQNYSVILMSQRNNAPYSDKILDDGITIEYEWHDEPKIKNITNPKDIDQPKYTKTWNLTQNGKFIQSINAYKSWVNIPERVKVYEKILSWIRSLKGFFNLIDYKVHNDWTRNLFVFILQLTKNQDTTKQSHIDLEHTRLIPSTIKKEVWKRDGWKCVLCDSTKNLHFDHDLPFSKWWTSLTSKNIKLLCMQCNLKKSNKIE